MDCIAIITFTEGQFALLTKGQLQTVKTAQQRKNRLQRKLQEELRKEKHRLVRNGIFNSDIFDLISNRLTEEYEREIELIKECLLFYLRYSMKPTSSDSAVVDAPYTVDYSLTDEERLTVVKDYYEQTYDTWSERFEAFKADTVAKKYLGELYAPLYDHFRMGAEDE